MPEKTLRHAEEVDCGPATPGYERLPQQEKRQGLCPGGRFPPSFIHQVIIITGLNKLYNCMFSP